MLFLAAVADGGASEFVSVLGYALVMLSVLLLSGSKLAGEPKLLGYWGLCSRGARICLY